MKKIILSTALLLAGFGLSSAYAQQNAANQTENATVSVEKIQADNTSADKTSDSKSGKKKHGKHRSDDNRKSATCAKVRPQGGQKAFEGITLTADQQAKLSKLNEETRAKREADRKQAQAERKQEREAYDKQLQQILTPEQMTQYNANRQKASEARKAKGGKAHGIAHKLKARVKADRQACRQQTETAKNAKADV